MTEYTVKNSTELATALGKAQGGDTIKMAAGNYGAVRFDNRNFASTVTLVSADPNARAEISSIIMNNASNVTFKSVEIGYALAVGQADYAKMADLKATTNIKFDDVRFRGSLDNNPGNDGYGLSVLNSSKLTVVNSTFEQLNRGMLVGSTTDIVVKDNKFHDLRSDGADFANVQKVEISGNKFWDFYPVGDDHPDAIQFWTEGTTKASTDILIKDNVILQGKGRGVQGIFLLDEVGSLPYERVRIENNMVYIYDGYNGIMVGGGKDVEILRNSVLSETTDAESTWIRLNSVTGATVKDNVADTFINEKSTSIVLDGNQFVDQNASLKTSISGLNLKAAATVEGLLVAGDGYLSGIVAPPAPAAVGPAPAPVAPAPAPAPAPTAPAPSPVTQAPAPVTQAPASVAPTPAPAPVVAAPIVLTPQVVSPIAVAPTTKSKKKSSKAAVVATPSYTAPAAQTSSAVTAAASSMFGLEAFLPASLATAPVATPAISQPVAAAPTTLVTPSASLFSSINLSSFSFSGFGFSF